jgi:hypothetical protein
MTGVGWPIGDAMATQKRQEQSAQAPAGVIFAQQSSNGELSEMQGHEVWKQRLEEDWQDHLETLQRYVCELLIKNQKLRMALRVAGEPQRGYGNAIKL